MRSQSLEATAVGTTTWVCPGGVTKVRLRGYGGGAGGGGGCGSPVNGTTSKWNCGGGGGGASILSEIEVAVVPGTTYELVIPAASAGGAGGAQSGTSTPNAGTNGVDGGAVLFREQGGATLATFAGASRGAGGSFVNSGASAWIYAPGGCGTGTRIPISPNLLLDITTIGFAPMGPGQGGHGMIANLDSGGTLRRGNVSIQGYAGGAGGETIYEYAPGLFTTGSSHTTWGDGAAGGGGAGGPSGAGGKGGDSGNSLKSSADGDAGGAGAANSGAGGGGGGAGAQLPVPNNGAGGVGGAGGTGKLTLTWTA